MTGAVIVGAGPAGLAAAAELRRARVQFRLLERGPEAGWTWVNLYDSLTLHTGRHMSTLPGMRYPRGTSLFPSRLEFLDYLRRYAEVKGIDVEASSDVTGISRVGGVWRVDVGGKESIEARFIVMATGIVASPRIPQFEGRELFGGRVLHSSEYMRPGPFIGRRVLVVGVGNSGGEIGSELAVAGVDVTVVVRSGAHVVPRQLGPLPAQYVRYLIGKLPRAVQERIIARVQRRLERKPGPSPLPRPAHHPLDGIPLIGFHLVDAIRSGSVRVVTGSIAAFTRSGVKMTDGREVEADDVILATGFSAALGSLGGVVRTDNRGFALRSDRVASADAENLWFIGHNYDHTGGLTNIRIDAPLIAKAVAGAC
ncbi:MAG: flavin-containing monooxygenase [Gemmatimonadota bacterium]